MTFGEMNATCLHGVHSVRIRQPGVVKTRGVGVVTNGAFQLHASRHPIVVPHF